MSAKEIVVKVAPGTAAHNVNVEWSDGAMGRLVLRDYGGRPSWIPNQSQFQDDTSHVVSAWRSTPRQMTLTRQGETVVVTWSIEQPQASPQADSPEPQPVVDLGVLTDRSKLGAYERWEIPGTIETDQGPNFRGYGTFGYARWISLMGANYYSMENIVHKGQLLERPFLDFQSGQQYNHVTADKLRASNGVITGDLTIRPQRLYDYEGPLEGGGKVLRADLETAIGRGTWSATISADVSKLTVDFSASSSSGIELSGSFVAVK